MAILKPVTGGDPRAAGGLVSNLPHPRVNKTKQRTNFYLNYRNAIKNFSATLRLALYYFLNLLLLSCRLLALPNPPECIMWRMSVCERACSGVCESFVCEREIVRVCV